MIPEEIPQEIVDLLDKRAGRKHSRDGIVLTTLAEILSLYDWIMIKDLPYCATCEKYHGPPLHFDDL